MRVEVSKAVEILKAVDKDIHKDKLSTNCLVMFCLFILQSWGPYVPESVREPGFEIAHQFVEFLKILSTEQRVVNSGPFEIEWGYYGAPPR